VKAEATIRKQIARLRKLNEDPTTPEHLCREAWEAYHALQWALEDASWTPAGRLEREVAESKGYET
jgi:hypothetical protein